MKTGGIGKLGKLKCMIRRWHAASSNHSKPAARPAAGGDVVDTPEERHGGAVAEDKIPLGLHPVYVGKSRRRYLVGSHLVDHPLFRVLVQRSGGTTEEEEEGGATTLAGCEVVLFEHLLWMLENTDPQSESLDELVEFYAC